MIRKIDVLIGLIVPLLCLDLSAETLLDRYIKIGLESNVVLKQKQIEVERSTETLKEARGMFLPSVTLSSRYTYSEGGREIELPFGDMLNPVHDALNGLLGAPAFPTDMDNLNIALTPEDDYQTSIEITQPLFNPGIYYNHKIQSGLKQTTTIERNVYKSELILMIKEAYYNYLRAIRSIKILDRMLELANDNLNVSEKLVERGVKTEEVIYSARTQIAELKQERTAVERRLSFSASYFNFLLNRSLSEPIEIENKMIAENFLPLEETSLTISLAEAEEIALRNREEIGLLKNTLGIANSELQLNQSSRLPTVTGVFEYGYQGEEFEFTQDNDYWSASIIGEWNIFSGMQKKSRINQAKLEMESIKLKLKEVTNNIRLDVKASYDDLIIAVKSIITAGEQLNSTRENFKIISKKYENGMESQFSYNSTQAELTEAELNHSISMIDYLIYAAYLEKAMNYKLHE